jgi:hypothetical protein
MKAVCHSLVGYDRQTESQQFALPVPPDAFQEVWSFVTFDSDDPQAAGCYELTNSQASRIAEIVRNSGALPSGLDFFLEGYN